MNTKAALALVVLVVSSAFSAAAFAQSGTITFTGSIVAPACTGASLNNGNPADVNLDACANPEVQVVRTSVVNNNDSRSTVQTSTRNNNSAVVTVTYE